MQQEIMPLQPILVDAQLMQWGLDVIGSIIPKSTQGHSYILTATDYFTRWKEVKYLKKVDIEELISFIKENILSHFGVPKKFIVDNGSIFLDQNLFPFAGFMVLLWYIIQIITHMETYLQNRLTRHSSKSSKRLYMIVRRIGIRN